MNRLQILSDWKRVLQKDHLVLHVESSLSRIVHWFLEYISFENRCFHTWNSKTGFLLSIKFQYSNSNVLSIVTWQQYADLHQCLTCRAYASIFECHAAYSSDYGTLCHGIWNNISILLIFSQKDYLLCDSIVTMAHAEGHIHAYRSADFANKWNKIVRVFSRSNWKIQSNHCGSFSQRQFGLIWIRFSRYVQLLMSGTEN